MRSVTPSTCSLRSCRHTSKPCSPVHGRRRCFPRRRLVLGGEACSVGARRRGAPACPRMRRAQSLRSDGSHRRVHGVPRAGRRRPSSQAATVPIGGPLDHVQVYALDGQRRIVPFWVTGELYIGPARCQRGDVCADTALTQEKFLPDPWGPRGARMYRTGDRVRMLPGGVYSILFLGRIDNQVKLRGFRVELGEVEASLRRHPHVKDVAMLAHDDGTGTRLDAFLGLSGWSTAHRCRCARVPPATRAARLHDPDVARGARHTASHVEWKGGSTQPAGPPHSFRNPERRRRTARRMGGSIVAGIWRELLGVDEIHARDDFYDLGGHSLMAIQVVTALERRARVPDQSTRSGVPYAEAVCGTMRVEERVQPGCSHITSVAARRFRR